MTLNKAISLLNGKIHACCTEDIDLSSGYCGDFLSFVMGKAPAGCLWFTVMNNLNVIAVATLAEVGAVVICEGVSVPKEVTEKAEMQGINLFSTPLDTFQAVKVFCQS